MNRAPIIRGQIPSLPSRGGANLRSLLLFTLIAALIVAALSARLSARLNYTGDEPRYLLQALSFALDGVAVMPEVHYEKFREAHNDTESVAVYPFKTLLPGARDNSTVPYHPVLVSLLLAPASASWPLWGVRLIPFGIAVIGLCFLAQMIVKQTTGVFSALACFIPAAACFPALPYQFLALPEIFLFTLSAVVFWNLSSISTTKIPDYIPAIACSCLAPLVHLRGLALFGTTAAYLGFRLFSTAGRGTRRAILSFATVVVAVIIAAFLADWMVRYGALRSITIRPIWEARAFADMLVHYRHGLLAYAPIWLLSFSGLIAALSSRRPWAIPALLFLLAFIPSSSSAIGEAYPGRFWVQAVPILSLCMSGFSEGVLQRPIKALIYLPLVGLNLANTVLFFFDPDLHLAARSGALPYDRLFELFPFVNFGFWLDVPDSSFVRLGAFAFCLLAVIVAARASIARSKLMSAIAVMLLLVGFEAHRVRPIPIVATAETNAITVRLAGPAPVSPDPIRFRFQAPWKGIGPRTIRPMIEVNDGDRHWSMPIMSGSLLCHKSDASPAEFSIRVTWSPLDPLAVDAAPGTDVQALACNSILANLW